MLNQIFNHDYCQPFSFKYLPLTIDKLTTYQTFSNWIHSQNNLGLTSSHFYLYHWVLENYFGKGNRRLIRKCIEVLRCWISRRLIWESKVSEKLLHVVWSWPLKCSVLNSLTVFIDFSLIKKMSLFHILDVRLHSHISKIIWLKSNFLCTVVKQRTHIN